MGSIFEGEVKRVRKKKLSSFDGNRLVFEFSLSLLLNVYLFTCFFHNFKKFPQKRIWSFICSSFIFDLMKDINLFFFFYFLILLIEK